MTGFRQLSFALFIATTACRSGRAPAGGGVTGTLSAASGSPNATSSAILDSSPPPARTREPDTERAIDFEDQFNYCSDDPECAGFPKGNADPTALTAGTMRYGRYWNGRFGFGLDVPAAFAVMPEPVNGDGQQWRIGKAVAMTASGMNWDFDDEQGTCPSSKNVTARRETKTSCFATGKANGFIFWERHEIARGVLYSLRFQYVESLKTAMDPVVTHVNASWRF
jgi:hypothetical protein